MFDERHTVSSRDRATCYLFKGLTKFPLYETLRAASILFVLGLIGFCGATAGQPINPMLAKNTSVFWAAPISSIFTGRRMVTFSIEYAPPPYLNVTFLYIPPTFCVPSKLTATPFRVGRSAFSPESGGTTGIDAVPVSMYVTTWAEAECSRVDIWLPSRDMTTAPTIKDPNATITIRIAPPSSNNSQECREWHYHYGDDAHKKPLEPKEIRGGGKRNE